jgi:hypothetical protein
MSVYLGTYGYVALRRKTAEKAISTLLRVADVTATSNRFALRVDSNAIVTGDYLYIQNSTNQNLDFVAASGWPDNQQHRDGSWYVNVDDLGGIRLYSTYAKAIAGGSDVIDLVTPATDLSISITVNNSNFLTLGQVTSYELSTQREAVDTTGLSEDFRSQYGALLSGSGSLEAFWNYQNAGEQSNYLLQLAIRTEIGGEFDARFYVKTANYSAEMGADDTDDEIFYEISGVITQAGIAFSPDSPVQVRADFVTTGPIRLRVRTLTRDELLQEDGSRMLLDVIPPAVTGAILLESSQ